MCVRACSSNIPHDHSVCTTSLRDGDHYAEAANPPLQDTRKASPLCQDNDQRTHEEPLRLEKTKIRLLQRWCDMPQHLQFNPHIRTGYRPLMTVGQCLGSLFYIHNETVNIMTHGKSQKMTSPLESQLGCFFVLWPGCSLASDLDISLLDLVGVCMTRPTVFSLFVNKMLNLC